MSLTVGILVYPEVEVLDFAGPYEVFTTASRVAVRREPGRTPPFTTFAVAAEPGTVRARAGLVIQPEHTLASHPPLDVLIVPGGVVDAELEKPVILEWLRQVSIRTTITASVCTGVFLLARAGLLGAARVTTHWEDVGDLRRQFPELDVVSDVRWVDEGRIVTSAGISAGIDMSLHLVERLCGRELAVATARQMEFDWSENPPTASGTDTPRTGG